MTTTLKAMTSSSLITIPTGSSLDDAQALMKEKRIRHLPIVDEENTIVGVLSQSDIRVGLMTQNMGVEMLMTSPVQALDQQTSLRLAILKMLELKISCLLITNNEDDVVGIVTTDDLLWHLAHMLKNEPKEDEPLLSALNLQTIGKLAHDLANFGI
ncbi:MAG: CBS domain-containing protein [Bdellovibrionales bacterium]|jgi:CBS domain-containing protein|nr:CBS domain-containing protein [Bdellovibrionales bacterium]